MRAAALLRDQISLCTASGALLESAAAGYALGCIVAGDEGDTLRNGAQHAMRELGVVDPERLMAVHFPELVNGRAARSG